MFIQDGDNYNSFEKDVLKDNNINLSVAINKNYLNKIRSDYDSIIDIFINNKDLITKEQIEKNF